MRSLADECAASAEQGGCPETPRVECTTVTDKECLDAFTTLSRMEGIIPALESAHAMREAPKMGKDQTVLVNLSGRGDKDADFVAAKLGL